MKHKVLYNQYATNPCAYCRLHKVSLTVKQVKMKTCIGKNCKHLVPYQHPYWTYMEKLKQQRIERKESKKKKQSVE